VAGPSAAMSPPGLPRSIRAVFKPGVENRALLAPARLSGPILRQTAAVRRGSDLRGKSARLLSAETSPFENPGDNPISYGSAHFKGALLRAMRAPPPSTIDAMSTSHDAEPAPHFHTPLLQVGSRQCRFIVSEGARDAICCGGPTTEASSWCSWHERVVFVPRLSERERHRVMSESRALFSRVRRQLPRAA
jgi:hypothetical protein